MLTLIIDTSTERGIVVIARKNNILYHAELPFGLQNSQKLIPELENAFSSPGLKLQDLDLIAVGIGPGSYTGIRVGVITAKTIAFACQKPLVGLCTLDGFIPDTSCRFAAMIDAKIGGVYLQTGDWIEGKAENIRGPLIVAWEEIDEHLQGIQRIVTPSAGMLRKRMENDPRWNHLVWQESPPSVERLLQVATEKYLAGDYSKDATLEILYMRKTQAEITKAAQNGTNGNITTEGAETSERGEKGRM